MTNLNQGNTNFRATSELSAISATAQIENKGPSPSEASMSAADKLFLKRMADAEQLSKTNPALYQAKVMAWAVLGYSFMIVMPIILVSLALALILLAAKMHVGWYAAKPILLALFALLAGVGCYLKALFVTFPKTEGLELTDKEYPDLWRHVRDVSNKVGIKVDRIFLNYEVNAAVIQRPRLGLFGFYENHLLLGVPLMMMLSPDEFRSVISHEFGHLAGEHSRKSEWIYKMSRRWALILEALQKAESPLLLLNWKFYAWFCPYFEALTSIIARQHEREADKLAIEISGAENHARSFLQLILRSDRCSSYEIQNLLREYPYEGPAPDDFYKRLQARLTAPLTDKLSAIDTLEADLLTKPSPYDSHPAHAERIACCDKVNTLQNLLPRLKAEKLIDRFAIMEPVEVSALEYFFGEQYQKLMDYCCQDWVKLNGEYWKERAQSLKAMETRNLELEQKRSAGETLTVEEELELVSNIHTMRGELEAMPLYANLYERHPDEPNVAFQLAAHSYFDMRDKKRGVELFEKVAKHGKSYRREACSVLLSHYDKEHDHERFQEYEKLYIKYAEEDEQYHLERSIVSSNDRFKPHTATDEEVEKVRCLVSVEPSIKAAYLVEKELNVDPENRMFVLVVRMKIDPESFGGESNAATTQAALGRLCSSVSFPGSGYVYIIPSSSDAVLKAIKSFDNVLIYP